MATVPTGPTAAQLAALHHVRTRGAAGHDDALGRIEAALGGAVDVGALVALIHAHARVTLNFHPDRFVAGGRREPVAVGRAIEGA